MIQSIDREKCVGCGACVEHCPLDTLRLDEEKKAYIAYGDDCMTCYICERVCPSGAVNVHPFREELPPVFPAVPRSLGGGAPDPKDMDLEAVAADLAKKAEAEEARVTGGAR